MFPFCFNCTEKLTNNLSSITLLHNKKNNSIEFYYKLKMIYIFLCGNRINLYGIMDLYIFYGIFVLQKWSHMRRIVQKEGFGLHPNSAYNFYRLLFSALSAISRRIWNIYASCQRTFCWKVDRSWRPFSRTDYSRSGKIMIFLSKNEILYETFLNIIS